MARSERHADVRRPPVGALPKVPHRNDLRCRLTALKIANYAANDFRVLRLQADAKLCSFPRRWRMRTMVSHGDPLLTVNTEDQVTLTP